MKRSIAAVIAILVLLVSLLCACKKDDTKTNADTTGEAQTSAAGDVVDDTTALPEDSTAQEGETNETQSADPAKPGETASNQVTAAPSKNAKDWTKAEIIAYFNTGANRVKYGAKSVTRNYTETKNDADKTEFAQGDRRNRQERDEDLHEARRQGDSPDLKRGYQKRIPRRRQGLGQQAYSIRCQERKDRGQGRRISDNPDLRH